MIRIGGKMTLTINPERYAEALSLYQPQVIKTEEENEKFLAIVEELMSRTRLTVEEDTILELLVRLIEEFEAQHYTIDASTPYSRLLHLMESRDLLPIDLVDVLGSSAAVKAIIEDHTAIDDAQAIVLGRFFHVNPSLLQH